MFFRKTSANVENINEVAKFVALKVCLVIFEALKGINKIICYGGVSLKNLKKMWIE